MLANVGPFSVDSTGGYVRVVSPHPEEATLFVQEVWRRNQSRVPG